MSPWSCGPSGTRESRMRRQCRRHASHLTGLQTHPLTSLIWTCRARQPSQKYWILFHLGRLRDGTQAIADFQFYRYSGIIWPGQQSNKNLSSCHLFMLSRFMIPNFIGTRKFDHKLLWFPWWLVIISLSLLIPSSLNQRLGQNVDSGEERRHKGVPAPRPRRRVGGRDGVHDGQAAEAVPLQCWLQHFYQVEYRI